MRLINVETHVLESFSGGPIPEYAILSHRWGEDDDEVSFADMMRGSTQKSGMSKVVGCCNQARKDEIKYVWIDTCCINKESSTELNEAISSMFRWYREASVCYTYMNDVPSGENVWGPASKFFSSSWFKRGWTLQELLAPRELRFYDQGWNLIGTKADLSGEIEKITGIPRKFLLGWDDFHQASVAQRMSWAANRETKRQEDIAYCLLGIFNVWIPMIYGEGEKAFERLQFKIIEETTDDSILAWGISAPELVGKQTTEDDSISAGIFASSPKDFARCGRVVSHAQGSRTTSTFTVSGGYVHTSLMLRRRNGGMTYGLLNCGFEHNNKEIIAIPLQQMGSSNEYIRPQNRKPSLGCKPSAKDANQSIRIQVHRQTRPHPASCPSFWVHLDGLQRLKLSLAETHPPLQWEKGRALIESAVDKTSETNRRQLLRFSYPHPKSYDLAVVMELSNSSTGISISSYLIPVPQDMRTELIVRSLEFLESPDHQTRTAYNKVIEVTLNMAMDPIQQGAIFSLTLEGTNNIPNVLDKHPEIITAKAKYDFMESLKREHQAKVNEGNKRVDLVRTYRRKDTVQATLRSIEEEERQLAARKRLLSSDMERLENIIAFQESQLQEVVGSHYQFRHDRLRFQNIVYGNTERLQDDPVQRALERLRLETKKDGQNRGNWFEKTIQRQLENVKPDSWPVQIGQQTGSGVPLLWAAANGQAQIAEILLAEGSDVEVKDGDDDTALLIAARLGQTPVVEVLLNHGAQLEVRNKLGDTPLARAAYGGHTETVNYLLQKGADIEARNTNHSTPLAIAARQGHQDVVNLLLQAGADIEARNRWWDTPLSRAASTGHEGVVKVLLNAGAKMEVKNKKNLTPHQLAEEHGHQGIIKLFSRPGGAVVSALPGRSSLPEHGVLGLKSRRPNFISEVGLQ